MQSENPDEILVRVRRICLELAGSSEKISHGVPAFEVNTRMFAYFRHNHHGDGKTVVCVKTGGREEQAMLIDADPALYSLPAYLGASGWISMSLAEPDTDWAHVEDRISASHALALCGSRRRK